MYNLVVFWPVLVEFKCGHKNQAQINQVLAILAQCCLVVPKNLHAETEASVTYWLQQTKPPEARSKTGLGDTLLAHCLKQFSKDGGEDLRLATFDGDDFHRFPWVKVVEPNTFLQP